MKVIVLKIVIIVLCMPVTSCNRSSTQYVTKLTPIQGAEGLWAINAYLECEECNNGELEALLKFGPILVPSLSAILLGSAPWASGVYKSQLRLAYRDMKKYEDTHPDAKLPMEEEEFVKTYLDNKAALRRIRAATALAAIGGDEARKALEKALELPLRDDVKLVIKNSLEKLYKR